MTRPPLKLEVKLGEETVELRWTYGLHQDLMRVIPSAEQVGEAVTTDAFIRDFVVRRCLTKLEKPIKDDNELIDLFTVEIDPDEILKVQRWAIGHVLYFFTQSAVQTARQGEELMGALQPKTP